MSSRLHQSIRVRLVDPHEVTYWLPMRQLTNHDWLQKGFDERNIQNKNKVMTVQLVLAFYILAIL